MWACSDDDFDELYCEVGKAQKPKRQKKQEDGHKKGTSKHSSSSAGVGDDASWRFGLFDQAEKTSDEEEAF